MALFYIQLYCVKVSDGRNFMYLETSFEEPLVATGRRGFSVSTAREAAVLSKAIAAPEEVSVDAAVQSVISELESIFALKGEQRTTQRS